jgi:metal transporter CNNM
MWVPILTSTVAIAVFAEILPQYFIPQEAIYWGYYCWPLIWGCMGLTAIVSWPLAWVLDHLTGRRDKFNDIFSNDELGTLIKYHERSETHGGRLGPDAARVMLGALNVDSRKIGGEMSRTLEPVKEKSEKDIEKAETVLFHGMTVGWDAVRTIDINQPVDRTFIDKVKSWSYSRIPVIGKSSERTRERDSSSSQNWEDEDTKIYGFLHTKVLTPYTHLHRRGC